MCGIAGIIYKNGQKPIKEQIQVMTDAMMHRGPDAEGIFIRNQIALGHRRLSIIDLTESGNQPMISQDEKIAIVFNGEIYNYIELKRELEERGVSFQNHTDTEVIIESYRLWGTKCIEHFNGMWAFALYDMEKELMFLSRDRLGIKPLYFINNAELFVFASEIKALIALLPEESIPNNDKIYNYIGGYPDDINEETFYKNIKCFMQANYMLYDIKKGHQESHCFWKVDREKFRHKWIENKNPYTTCREILENAIKIRLRADVEVGACLSGGLDSSTIVGIASKKYKKKIHTFSSIYEEKKCDEREYITAVNRFNNTIPHPIYPEVSNEFIKELIDMIIHRGGPTPGASNYSQYCVMKGITGTVKVVLDGQGADELFAGYETYYLDKVKDILSKDSFWARIKALRLLIYFGTEYPEYSEYIPRDCYIQILGEEVYMKLRKKGCFQKKGLSVSRPLVTESFKKMCKPYSLEKAAISNSFLENILYRHTIQERLPELLHNEDGNSMTFSIETRLPFLDYRLVEFAMALDGKYKIKNTWTKWILRKSCKKYLPHKVLHRKNKMGFPAPFDKWIKESSQKEELKEIIFDFGKRDIVPLDTIATYYDQHKNDIVNRESFLFKVLQLELWFRECIDKQKL